MNSEQGVGIRKPLSHREQVVVEVVAAGGSQTAGARLAGYGTPDVRGSQVMSRPHVQAALADRRSAAMKAAGIDLAETWEGLAKMARDNDGSWKRAPAVRASEIILRGAQEIGAEVTVAIDARSILIPGAADLGVAELEAQLAQLSNGGAVPDA